MYVERGKDRTKWSIKIIKLVHTVSKIVNWGVMIMTNQLKKDGVSKELAKEFAELAKNKKKSIKLNSVEVKKK